MFNGTETAATTRQCRVCYRELPLDGANFHRHCNYAGGFRWICKPCRSQKRKEDDRERCTKATKTLLLRMARDICKRRSKSAALGGLPMVGRKV